MTVDTGKGFSLPSGPATLCFDKEEFMRPGFKVDDFVIECRRRVQLETLCDDLNVYLKILKSAMIELINKDYADFVNLSTNLVGMDKAIGHLTVPLGQLKEEVLSVRTAMDEAIEVVERKLNQQKSVQQKKACLQRLMNITHSVERIEKLLGIQMAPDTSETQPVNPGQLSGQLIERVATEFNKLQFYVTKSRGLPLVEKIKPRIANITTTLQFSLEGAFLDGLATVNVEILRQCLRTYALIDKTKDAENLFRQHIVKPYMEEIITEQFIKANGNGLMGLFDKVLEFIPKHCKVLKDVTSGSSGTMEIVRGYDFLVNSVWPEIVSNFEARTPSIFAPGNPDIFHEKYLQSMEFLTRFERCCGSQASVKRLRDHPSYHTFLHKWSLPVYFQIRFQDLAGSVESALITGFNNSTEQSSPFKLHSTAALWQCLQRCWNKEIYLSSLSHRFWKLTLQILSRYTSWLDEVHEEETNRRKEAEKPVTMRTSASTSSLDKMSVTSETIRSVSPAPQDLLTTSTTTSNFNPPITVGQIVCLISDAVKLTELLDGYFVQIVKPCMELAGYTNTDLLQACLQESVESLELRLPKFQSFVSGDVIKQCSVYLKQVNDIPRLYRKTNREVPSKPSSYVTSLTKPLDVFLEEHSDSLAEKQREDFLLEVFSNITEQYVTVTSDVLTSVRKMEESLKRLKKARGTDKTNDSNSHGMSDDDKVRQQIIIDVKCYGEKISSKGIQKTSVVGFERLQELSQEAKSAMTS
ncbi:conserved oligomeric Golgi complex subunit 2 [Patella vulgata]|uniref:conserved oligomeric Golgi complex subunit 2 n=1 Tax=Patella vulgata TaxID=6465 RepID=UPI00217FB9C8|nr:conserved oligomeric Golgi complex subunit 2 [Patella vulgata]